MDVFVIVEVASEKVALPAAEVEQVLRMVALTRVPRAEGGLEGVVDVHGVLVPVVELRAWLGAGTRPALPEDHLVVLRRNGRRVALRVDRVLDLATVEHAAVVASDAWAGRGVATAAVRLPDGVAMIPALDALIADAQGAAP